MKNATIVMREALKDVNINRPPIKFVNNVNADFVDDSSEIKKLLIEQIESRVRWRESIYKALTLSLDLIIEIGPGKVLTGLNKRMDIDAEYFNISTIDDINIFLETYGEIL